MMVASSSGVVFIIQQRWVGGGARYAGGAHSRKIQRSNASFRGVTSGGMLVERLLGGGYLVIGSNVNLDFSRFVLMRGMDLTRVDGIRYRFTASWRAQCFFNFDELCEVS